MADSLWEKPGKRPFQGLGLSQGMKGKYSLVYHNGPIVTSDQRWNLVPPIATMAEAAM